jgi:zona occludens toxin (predicted ATPase)
VLTLITGAPGAGKGLAGVDLVRKLVAEGRPLFVLEVPEENVAPVGLKLPHTLLGADQVQRWHELVPDGAVVYAPEAQRIWPARPPATKTPAHAEAVGQHRHRGIDMVLDTQAPKLLDDKVRLRVGRHIHLRDLGIFQGRHWYEWPELGNPERWKTANIKKKFKLPKGVQELYTSATTHIKPVRSFPPSVIVMAVAGVILLVILGRFGYRVLTTGSLAAPGVQAAPAPARPASSPAPVAGIFAPRSPVGQAGPTFPFYSSGRVVAQREPYDLRGLQLEGEYSIGASRHAVFGVLVAGQRVTSVTLDQLLRAGYTWVSHAPCAGVLRFADAERMVTCALPGVAPRPQRAASSPIDAQL